MPNIIRLGPDRKPGRRPFLGSPKNPLGELQTYEVTRAPLYVTGTWRRWPLFDQSVNIAVLAVVVSAAVRAPPIEPTFTRRRAPQIDFTPNLAVLDPRLAYIQATDNELPAVKRTQPELYPNIAVRVVAAPTRVPSNAPEPIAWKRAVAVELAPNLAVRLQTQVAPPPLDPPLPVRRSPGIDLTFNVAIQPAPPAFVPRSTPEPTYARKLPTTWDVLPNLAIRAPAEAALVPRTTPEPLYTRRWAAQPEISLDYALYAAPAAVLLRAPVEPTYTRRLAPQLDHDRNVAALTPAVFLIRATLEPTFTRRRTPAPDLYPNLALRAPPETILIREPIEPKITFRYDSRTALDLTINVAVHFAGLPPAVRPGRIVRAGRRRSTAADSADRTADARRVRTAKPEDDTP